MKFDLFKWQEIKPNEEYEAPQGLLHVMCDEKAAVYIASEGFQVLAGVGHQVKINTAHAVTVTVKAPAEARVFMETPQAHHVKSSGEVYTNLDKRPTDSIAVQEVKRALREFKYEQAQIRAQMRAEAEAFKRAKASKQPISPEPEPETVSEPNTAE